MGPEKCENIVNGAPCNKQAEYFYGPAANGDPFYFCSDCLFSLSGGIPCSCEIEDGEPPDCEWKWLDKGKTWYKVDEQGRPFPCCEYLPI